MQRLERLRSLIPENTIVYITSRANVFYYSHFNSDDVSLLISNKRQVLITDSRYTFNAKISCPDFEIFDIKDGIDKIFSEFSEENVGFEEENLTVGRLNRLKEKTDKEFIPFEDKIKKIKTHKLW